MKLSTRAIMAILLAALAIGYLVTVPAEAAKTETVVTYRGYTLSWSEPDASDLRIVRTPGVAESFPAQASDRSIDQPLYLVLGERLSLDFGHSRRLEHAQSRRVVQQILDCPVVEDF